MKRIIHVNRQAIAQNLKDGGKRNTLIVRTWKSHHTAWLVEIDGPSVLFDAERVGRKPLSCGARVWIETKSPVKINGELSV